MRSSWACAAFGSEVPIPGFSLLLEENSVIGSLYGSANMRRVMPKLINLYMRARLEIDELVSRRIKLDDVNPAFEAMEKGEVARSVIVCADERRPGVPERTPGRARPGRVSQRVTGRGCACPTAGCGCESLRAHRLEREDSG